MAPQNWDWVFIALAWTLAGVGLLLALWALFWDRSRGRERCPRCWYSMEGAVADGEGLLTCPECGKEIGTPKRLAKTRRRWRLVALALIPFWAASVSYRVNWPGREGFMAAVPTTALVLIVSDYTAQDVVTQSLLNRLWQEPIAPWDMWLALHREAAVMPEDWGMVVKHRAKWPVGMPVRVEIDARLWMCSEFAFRNTTMQLKGDNATVATVHTWPHNVSVFVTSTPPDWLDLPAPTLGENRYTLVLEHHAGSTRLARREVEIVFEGVKTAEEAIGPFAGAALPLQSMLEWRIWEDLIGQQWALGIDAEDFYSRAQGAQYEVRLKKDGAIIAVAQSGNLGHAHLQLTADNPMLLGVTDFENDVFSLDGLTLEFVPDLKGALRDFDHNTYWDGGFELPLRSVPFMGHDGSKVYPFLVQADEIPLDLLSQMATETQWLRENAVKQSPPSPSPSPPPPPK